MEKILSKFTLKLRNLQSNLTRQIKLPSIKNIFVRAIIATFSVFIFLYVLEAKELFNGNQKSIKIYLFLALMTATIHLIIWGITLFFCHILEIKHWTLLNSIFLKCIIGFSILCCLYIESHYLGIKVDLAFFIKWGLIMSPSFAVAILFYEINQSFIPVNLDENLIVDIKVNPTFQLLNTSTFLYAITCKKAYSLDNSMQNLSNGIFLYFEDGMELHNSTLSNFLLANNEYEELVRCHDSYIVNLKKITQFDKEQRLIIIRNTKIPLSKNGGNGIESLTNFNDKILRFTQK